MSRERVVIDNDLRPPVVLIDGRSPFKISTKHSRTGSHDLSGSPTNKSKILTENGKLMCEMTWDQRHHISPSLFNN